LLYQPWSAEYLNRYVPQSLLNYTPPELNLARPTYMPNPLGLMELIEIAEEEVASEDESKDKDGKKKTEEDGRGGGKGPGDIGYATNSPGSVEAKAEAEAGLAESNAATNAAGGWGSPVG